MLVVDDGMCCRKEEDLGPEERFKSGLGSARPEFDITTGSESSGYARAGIVADGEVES